MLDQNPTRECAAGARPSTPVTAVAQLMARHQLRAIPVSDGGHYLGIVTDWDISCRTVMCGKEIAATTVADVMPRGAEQRLGYGQIAPEKRP